MGMFDRLYDGEGREWQTKALGCALSSFEVGDRVHRADDSYQFEILGPITGNIGESEFALATMRDGVLAEIDAERDAELPLLTYGGSSARRTRCTSTANLILGVLTRYSRTR